MKKVICSPGKYIQGGGELLQLPAIVKAMGKKGAFCILTPSMMKRYAADLTAGFGKEAFPCTMEEFGRECCQKEIDRLREQVAQSGADVIVGIGGGKALDTAKAVAYYCELPVAVVPTIASTDAPCSALSVVYTEDGQFERYLMLPKNPDVVVVDTAVVAGAPARLLVAGMGDALATYYEARACSRSGAASMAGGVCSVSALALATACRDTLFSDGLKAKLAMEQGMLSQAVENIVEANTYLSGIGFESGGLAAAHAVHNGFTVLEDCHQVYHGEKVAFGTIVQLVLENADLCEIRQVIDFCKSVGLPTTLSQLGVLDSSPQRMRPVAEAACAEGETIHNMPFPVTADDVLSAIYVADQLGQ